MKNWTVGKRIITGGLTLLLLLLVVIGLCIHSLYRTEALIKSRIRDDSMPGMVYSNEILSYSLRTYIRSLVVANVADPAVREKALTQISINIKKVDDAMKAYETAIFFQEDRQNFEQLKQSRAAFSAEREAYLTLVLSNKSEAAKDHLLSKLEPAFIAY